MEISMVSADLSGKELGASGASVLAAFLPKCMYVYTCLYPLLILQSDIPNTLSDIRALTSLHVGKNSIPEKEMREIMAIAVHMDSMKILCEVPFKDKTLTALDVSGKNLGMEGALVVAEYLDGNGAITSLNLSSNSIGGYQDGPRMVATPEGTLVVTAVLLLLTLCFMFYMS
jgi:hypothetical protein